MTFGRWLLVHSLSISILVMLGVGYYFKNELKLNEAYSQLLQIDPDSISLPSHSTKNSSKKSELQEDQVVELTVVKKPASNDVVILPEQALSDMSSEHSNTEAVSEKNTVIDKQLISTNVNQLNVNEQSDYLLMARQAFWDKNYQSSINYYAKEMVKTPKSPDLYGELGNLYYGLKNYELASHNYLEAGKLMIEIDDQVRAKQMYDILLSLAPEKADVLLTLKNDKYQ